MVGRDIILHVPEMSLPLNNKVRDHKKQETSTDSHRIKHFHEQENLKNAERQ